MFDPEEHPRRNPITWRTAVNELANVSSIDIHCPGTYYSACCHLTPNKLFTAALSDKTSDVNQNPFTLLPIVVSVVMYENCIIVAVTAEQKVASVDRLSRLVVV